MLPAPRRCRPPPDELLRTLRLRRLRRRWAWETGELRRRIGDVRRGLGVVRAPREQQRADDGEREGAAYVHETAFPRQRLHCRNYPFELPAEPAPRQSLWRTSPRWRRTTRYATDPMRVPPPRTTATAPPSTQNAPKGGPDGPAPRLPLVHQPGSKRLMEAFAPVGEDRDAELLAGREAGGLEGVEPLDLVHDAADVAVGGDLAGDPPQGVAGGDLDDLGGGRLSGLAGADGAAGQHEGGGQGHEQRGQEDPSRPRRVRRTVERAGRAMGVKAGARLRVLMVASWGSVSRIGSVDPCLERATDSGSGSVRRCRSDVRSNRCTTLEHVFERCKPLFEQMFGVSSAGRARDTLLRTRV